jgi:hypothetical protein
MPNATSLDRPILRLITMQLWIVVWLVNSKGFFLDWITEIRVIMMSGSSTPDLQQNQYAIITGDPGICTEP